MKVQIALLGLLFCMATDVFGQPGQSAPTNKVVPVAQRSLTGCVDEQFGSTYFSTVKCRRSSICNQPARKGTSSPNMWGTK
jgi:hypothetical protein